MYATDRRQTDVRRVSSLNAPIATLGEGHKKPVTLSLAFVTELSGRIAATDATRSSADADNRLDAFSGQSTSTNMVPFHMLYIVSYCAIVTLSLRRAVFTIFVFKKFHDLEMGVKGHSRSLRVISFDRLCMVSY